MRWVWAAIRVGLLDMRGDARRFGLLIACLAVGTSLIAGVSSVGSSIKQVVARDAAVLMGGDLELSRADRAADDRELALFASFGQVSRVIDTNVGAQAGDREAFVDLVSIGPTYPLLGRIDSPDLPAGESPYDFLSQRDGLLGALVDPLMLDDLGVAVGDTVEIGGTPFEVRGALFGLPDGAVRGFRLGRATVITIDGLAMLADTTSPLPGLGTWFRYKLLLDGGDPESSRAALGAALSDPSWTIRSAREGLGPMMRYYDLFMRFLVIVGLASLLIGGVSVWTSMSGYVAERANVIAVLRSMGADRARIFLHFFSQIATLAVIGVGLGLMVGGGVALLALPIVGRAVGVTLAPTLHAGPLLVAAGVGLLTAFAFSYLPLQQAQNITPVTLFRSKGLAAPPVNWRALFSSLEILPLVVAAAGFLWLAIVMTDDPVLVAAFALVSVLTVVLFRLVLAFAGWLLERLPEPPNRLVYYALRDVSTTDSNAPLVVISVGLALATLVVVLVLEVNLRNEYLGASAFDAPTFVASDLFEDEVATLQSLRDTNDAVISLTTTPMLRGAVTAINGVPVEGFRPRGPEASFLLSGDVPMTYRDELPSSSRVVAGEWWPAHYQGPPLVSLHQSLRAGLGVNIGDRLTFTIFGDEITAEIASFRDYSWQGGIDFLATFSPGVLESYPTTLFGAVTTAPGRESEIERYLASALPDVRFIAIGATLERITSALGQLSLAASLVGGLAVGNGLLVLLGSLATGSRQRQADAVITKVLGASRLDVLLVSVVRYLILATFAALIATPLGMALAWILTLVLLDVEFAFDAGTLAAVDIGAIVITGALGATTILRALASRPAMFLRELDAE
ncbi:MAG TPA: FtsX-like permease family protein [Devosia sp.]|nr:FtsX-like permease family protein [Devosia sp.]